MSLSLKILSIKGEPISEEAVVFNGEGSIGRSGNNTLVLPDPDKFVSRTHALIKFENQQYVLQDLSLSGTYIDQEAQPIKDTPRVLSDGMLLRIGNYQVLVSIAENNEQSWADFGADAFPAPKKDDDPSLIGNDDNLVAYTPDEENELNKLLSNQQDSPFSEPSQPQADTFESLVNANLSPLHDSFTPPAIQQAVEPATATTDTNELMPDDFNFEELFEAETSHQNKEAVPADYDPIQSDFTTTAFATDDNKLCGAFLEGAKLNTSLVSTNNAAESMQRIGQMFRKLVKGTMSLLKARAELKNMFRVNQTYIKTHDNNALKFSASTEEALSYLIGNSESGFKDSLDAIDEGFDDIMLHQMAMQAGIQASLKEILKKLDPQKIEAQVEDGLLLQKKSKCWEKYVNTYPQLKEDVLDDFFGEEFAKAYELQIMRLKQAKK